MTKFTYVRLFLSLSLVFFQAETYAQSKCEKVFRPVEALTPGISKVGGQVLHEKDSRLHMSAAVERAVSKNKAVTGDHLTRPADKINLWLTFLEKISQRADSSPATLNQVKIILQNQFAIKHEEIPQSYYDFQARLARERGQGNVIFTNEQKMEMADKIVIDQKRSLDSWTEYLVSKDTSVYPMWLKYWMYTGMTKLSKYDFETGKFSHRDKDTVAPFPELNREALGLVADSVLKYLNKKSLDEIQDPELMRLLPNLQFGKIYGHILFKLNVGREGAFKTNQGQWVVYRQGSDHRPLVNSLKGRNTGWCTVGESTAHAQLSDGDFHVYYSLDEKGLPTIPRVAIRMEQDQIAEVRGVAADQNLDPQINQSHVVVSKMKEFGARAEQFQKRDHDMKLLTRIETKHNLKVPLEKEELRFLWELDGKIEGFGHKQDPRINEIRSQRDLKSDIFKAYDYKFQMDEITTTKKEFLNGKSKIHIGDLNINDIPASLRSKLPEILIGDLKGTKLKTTKGLKLPVTITGNIYLSGLKNAEGLIFPETVKGDIFLSQLTTAEGLTLPKTINGSLMLFSLKNAKGLKLPETINEDLYLDDLDTARGLKLPAGVRYYNGPSDIAQ